MTDIRTRLADALRDNGVGPALAEILSDTLLSLPGIAIVELPNAAQHEELHQFAKHFSELTGVKWGWHR